MLDAAAALLMCMPADLFFSVLCAAARIARSAVNAVKADDRLGLSRLRAILKRDLFRRLRVSPWPTVTHGKRILWQSSATCVGHFDCHVWPSSAATVLGACPEIVFGLLPPTFGAALQERDGRPGLVEHIEVGLSQTVDNVLQQHADALYAAHTAAADGVARLLRDALARSPQSLLRLEAEQAEWWPQFWDQQLVSRIATELRRWAALFATKRHCGCCMPRAGYKLDAHLPVDGPTDRLPPPLVPCLGAAGPLGTCSLTPVPRTTSSCPACLGCCASRWGAPRSRAGRQAGTGFQVVFQWLDIY